MPVINETARLSDWLKREADSNFSREQITIASGAGSLPTGRVLGKIMLGAVSAAAKAGGNAANTGALTLDATTPRLAGAQVGVYTVRCIAAASNSGTFRVEAPNGVVLGDIAVGATFADQIKFSIADGSQDFIVGEGFDVTVAAGSGKFTSVTAAAIDGSQTAAAILIDPVDATSADATAVAIVRDAIVSRAGLSYGADVDTAPERAAVHAALAALNPPILVREGA